MSARLLSSCWTIMVVGVLLLVGRASAAEDNEDVRLQSFVATEDRKDIARDPTLRTIKSLTTSEAAWTPVSGAFVSQTEQLIRLRIAQLSRSIDRRKLSADAKVRYDMYLDEQNTALVYQQVMREGATFGANVFDPIWELPQNLQRLHKVTNIQDARNYVSRLAALPEVLADVIQGGTERLARGVVLTRTSYTNLARQARELSMGTPCEQPSDPEGPRDHVLAGDLKNKLGKLDVAPIDRDALLKDADEVLRAKLCPSYASASQKIEAMIPRGRTEGMWVLPNGKEAYRDVIEFHLGERTDPALLHRLGDSEARRLRKEIQTELARIGFHGKLRQFNEFVRSDARYSVANTPEGFERYIGEARAQTDFITQRLPQYFHYVPKGKMVIRRTTQGPTGSGGGGTYYTLAAFDGSAPGYYNLDFPANEPRISLVPLATVTFHEGVPGHHMQQATALELQTRLPLIKYEGYMSYLEGWGLYGEQLAYEMGGFQEDPYRLIAWRQAQLERAVRLVLDTGLNSLGWNLRQAEEYQMEMLGRTGSLNRYLAWPGQALGYYWGYLELMRLRAKARQALGPKFDLKHFHHIVLKDGAISMPVLGRAIDNWIASVKLQDGRSEHRSFSE